MKIFLFVYLVLNLAITGSAFAQTQGNVLVANEGIVYEYTPTGAFVGQLTSDLRNGVFSESRGIAYDRFGRMHVLIRPHDGDDDMFLATVDPSPGTIAYNEISFHNHNGNTTYGDIAADQNYVYAPDQIFSRQEQGVIRYPLNDLSSPERILEQYQPTDVSIGLDGNLYVQTSNGGDIDIIDPDSLVRIGGFRTVNNMRDVEATAEGTIFTLHNDQMVRRYSADGTLEASLQLANEANHSMALSSDGILVIGSSGSDLFFTDTSLSSFTRVATPASTEPNWGNFVTFAETAAVPEPILLGDTNLDGVVDFLDISPFIAVFSGGAFQAEADTNEDAVVDFLDISPFIAILSGS